MSEQQSFVEGSEGKNVRSAIYLSTNQRKLIAVSGLSSIAASLLYKFIKLRLILTWVYMILLSILLLLTSGRLVIDVVYFFATYTRGEIEANHPTLFTIISVLAGLFGCLGLFIVGMFNIMIILYEENIYKNVSETGGNSKKPTGSSTLLHVKNVQDYWNTLKDKVKITTPLTEFAWGTYFGFKDHQNYSLGYYTKKNPNPQETQFTESINDFKKSRNFYEQILGFECIEDWDRGEFDKGAIFKIGLNRLEIINRNRPGGVVPPKTETIVCWRVDNVWNEWKRLKDTVKIVYPLRESSKNYFSFGFFDVDGLVLEFFSMKQK
eukprot:gene5603-9420_t